jgi:hypothetical protein
MSDRQGYFQNGGKGGPGRPPGALNKQTRDIRQAYQNLVEMNLENMTSWLASVAAEDPEKAMDLMLKLSEYIIPKLARQEVVGNDGSDLFKNVRFNFGPDINSEDEREDV